MRRTVLAVLLLAVVTAGCAAQADRGSTATTSVTTAEPPTTPTTESPDTTATEPADADPQKGDQFLSVMELNESDATAVNASKRATFGNLSDERQRVVEEAVECDCHVELDGEFSFHDKDRIEVVYYDGRYYFLRVAIV